MSGDPLRISFAEATKVWALDSHTYGAFFHDVYGVGSVPHGGYVATCFLKIAALHLRTQPDALTAHFEFLIRSEYGPAVFVVEEVKRGRQTSVLHISLYQRDLLSQAPWTTANASRREVTAYLSQTELSSEDGLTLETDWELRPAPAPFPVSLDRVGEGADPHWPRFPMLAHKFRPAFDALEYYSAQETHRGMTDWWVRFAPAGGEGERERFTNTSLGFVADAWPFPPEAYRPPRPAEINQKRVAGGLQRRPQQQQLEEHREQEQQKQPPSSQASAAGLSEEDKPHNYPFTWNKMFWYPTLVMNIDVKKKLPPEGVEWLFLRVQAKQIRKGRYDMEVIVMDEAGELVAICSHVNLVLDAARNLEQRKSNKEGDGGGDGGGDGRGRGRGEVKGKSHI